MVHENKVNYSLFLILLVTMATVSFMSTSGQDRKGCGQ